MSRLIPVAYRGEVVRHAVVDDEDYDFLAKYRWTAVMASKWPYVRRYEQGRTILMHRQILGLLDASNSIYGDHVNGNAFDNRRSNLRITDNKGNQGNRIRITGKTSVYRGVYCNKGRYQARIRQAGKVVYLGLFDIEEEAAEAYNDAAREHFGEFARLNVVLSSFEGR